ncbi:MAG: M23 family metallopeptidase [Candidatus Carbobacillus altaicus]|nr:M23 family metallopeptidase [Candidatus Carbobacillus altaicus]
MREDIRNRVKNKQTRRIRNILSGYHLDGYNRDDTDVNRKTKTVLPVEYTTYANLFRSVSIFFVAIMSVVVLLLGLSERFRDLPFAEKVQSVRHEIAAWGERAGVKTFLDKFAATSWSLLPTLKIERKSETVHYRSPVEGSVYAFYEHTSGVVIETGAKSIVHPVATGWVRSVMDTATRGRVITILHADGTESMYGFMGEVWVRAGDWVEPEDPIGRVKEQSLFLSLRRTGSLIDPAGVIRFD